MTLSKRDESKPIDTVVFERAVKFAEEAGTIALGSRDQSELVKLYQDFAIDIVTLFNEQLRRQSDVQE